MCHVRRLRGQHARKAMSIIQSKAVYRTAGADRGRRARLRVEREVAIGHASSHDNTIFLVAFSEVSVSPEYTGRAALFRQRTMCVGS